MSKITQKEKIERFDDVSASLSKNQLALHDVVNSKFGIGVWVKCSDFDEHGFGRYLVKMSWRAMPLFLVRYCAAGQDDQVVVWTDEELLNYSRNNQTVYWRMMMSARNELIQKQLNVSIRYSIEPSEVAK